MVTGEPRPFVPDIAYFDADALGYPLGAELRQRLHGLGVKIVVLPEGRRTPRRGRVGGAAAEYVQAKSILVAGVERGKTFQKCRPSADYQLPLAKSCPGMCAYCYLQTTLGVRPYVRVSVNLEEILAIADGYAERNRPGPTTFEAAATGDPVATEWLTGLLAGAIAHTARREDMLLRVVTKFAAVDSLLGVPHRGRTRVRLSVNTPAVVERWERGTSPLAARLEAAAKLAAAGYPIGFLVAPVFAEGDWQPEYANLIDLLADTLVGGGVAISPGADGKGLTFEAVTHRFTPRARELIDSRHARTGLPMGEEGRVWRMGQFGYGKYLYRPETVGEVKEFFRRRIEQRFPGATLEYVV